MTTEELKNAAGFKAVDAEGNELGVVSLSDIVSAVKQELQPSGVARASVAALSEVSAQAATDTYEDQLPQKTDVTWIRGLDESGNPILISKQSLVSVAEGLMKFRFPCFSNNEITDVNNAKSGTIHINEGTLNNPANDVATLITFPSGAYSPQIIIKWDNTIFYRYNNTESVAWKKINGNDI